MNWTSETIIDTNDILLELQSLGLKMENMSGGAQGRKGGAGPSDHKAVTFRDHTIMVPVYNRMSQASPYRASAPNELGVSALYKEEEKLGSLTYPRQPEFYNFTSSDGVPMWKIATLHSHDVLATTILQNCIRYNDRETSCQFCAIGESLKAGTTIGYKKPHHLAEVAQMAVMRDGVSQFVMTTGTPATFDRGAELLFKSVKAVKDKVDIPIQVQCEPPDDFTWFQKLKDAGADTIGMHLEAISEPVRKEIMPGKAEVSVEYYLKAFKQAVDVFGKAQVSTYILAGLGDTKETIINFSEKLIDLGVYPFIVPFVPISQTPLENHQPPSMNFMREVLNPVSQMLYRAGMTSDKVKSGCAKCGACSTLQSFEKRCAS